MKTVVHGLVRAMFVFESSKTARVLPRRKIKDLRSNNKMAVTKEELKQYLAGMQYPATKNELVDQARASYAPESLVITVDHLSDKTYNSISEVEQEFARHHVSI
jgi:hypothetical protein